MSSVTVQPRRRTPGAAPYRLLAGVEVALAAVAVVLDLLIPALVILALAGVSLAARRQRPDTLGFHRLARPWRTAGAVALVVLGWSALQLAVLMPALEHLTGRQQDLSTFADLEGDVRLLALLLVASWTLAALGEETACRGYVLTRASEAVGGGLAGTVVGVLVAALLFGLLHTEQGVVGVVVTFLDGLLFGWLRVHHGSVWAAVLGHGFSNTLGLVVFFAWGPVGALW
jgi:membrane protease YdiL (CAAX protease family)